MNTPTKEACTTCKTEHEPGGFTGCPKCGSQNVLVIFPDVATCGCCDWRYQEQEFKIDPEDFGLKKIKPS